MRSTKGFFALLLVLILQGCTSFFFYPDDITYRVPDFYDLTYDDIYFDSSDKTRLHAWHIYPNTDSKGLIFLAHGNAQNLSSHFVSWVWLIKEGYELFIFDYRGYGKSEGKSSMEGGIEDTKAALDYLERSYKKGYFVCGQSLGATLVTNAIDSRDTTRIKALILDSAFTGIADIAKEKMEQGILTWPFQWIPYLSLSNEYDIKEKIAKLEIPILLIHGSQDQTVFPNNSWQLFERSSMPKELWIVKRAKHIQSLELEEVQKAFLEFLQKEQTYFHSDYSRMRIYE